jgi:hypothetical protein
MAQIGEDHPRALYLAQSEPIGGIWGVYVVECNERLLQVRS